MNKAVFLDRDGVINPLVYNLNTKCYESPKVPEDFSVFTYTARALRLLKDNGFRNIVVSNQPDYAKGKATKENLNLITELLLNWSIENDYLIDEFYYCYHHPNGIVPEYTCDCKCRKPGTLFVEQAIKKYGLDRLRCIFVGDRKTDIQCAEKAKLRSVRILSPHPQDNDIGENQVCSPNFLKAAEWIVNNI